MKGMIFKPESIQAIIEGRKIQTRRVIKPQPKPDLIKHANSPYWISGLADDSYEKVNIPRYQVGEVVYIKEAYWKDSEGNLFDYALDAPTQAIPDFCKLMSPLFMPEWAARYFIEITDVRAERLQEINRNRHDEVLKEGYPFGYDVTQLNEHPINTFARYWNSINKDYPFESNPWVWVYTFRLKEEK